MLDENCLLPQVARAGRFGTKGLAITFVSDENDAKILNDVQERFEVNITELPDEIDISSYSKCTTLHTQISSVVRFVLFRQHDCSEAHTIEIKTKEGSAKYFECFCLYRFFLFFFFFFSFFFCPFRINHWVLNLYTEELIEWCTN